jgi:hypothetical protein
MTNEDYLKWLESMVKHNKKMSANTDGKMSFEYWCFFVAYKKAYDVFRDDVIEEIALRRIEKVVAALEEGKEKEEYGNSQRD